MTEPQATFSTCFGAPFLPRHPSVYAEMLGELIAAHGATAGWSTPAGPAAPTASASACRSSATRALLHAALDGQPGAGAVGADPVFGLRMPQACPDVDPALLEPASDLGRQEAYDQAARDLAARFEANFEQFCHFVRDEVQAAGIRAAA